MLSTGSYLAAAAETLILVGAAGLGAVALRRRLLPGWRGAPAWLASAVLTVALLLWVAELLGALGLLREAPLVLCSAALGLGLHLLDRRRRPQTEVESSRSATPSEPGTPLRLAGIAVAALAIAHFTVGIRLRLSTGMTGFDSTWYHGPFAAGFAQSGETLDLQLIAPQFLTWFYPHGSELLHGLGIAVFERDLLSPLLNLAWLVGCLTAAWCIGRPYGAAPLSLAGVAVALNTGALADQAGEARNDLMAAFFVLAALAVLLNASGPGARREVRSGALAVVGIAAGLAAGTKLNFLAPALALVLLPAALVPPGTRTRAVLATALPALAAGGFWYVRNLVHSGSPLPWVKELGPIGLPSPDQQLGGRDGHSVISYLGDGAVWSDWLRPGLEDAFGTLWPALGLLALAGLVLSLGRRSEPVLRACAGVGIVLLVSWVLAPTSASGPEGEPRGFVSGLRYLAPALAVGMALLPLAPPLRAPARRWVLLAALAVVLPFSDASGEPWHDSYLAVAIAAGIVAGAAALALGSPRLAALPRAVPAGAAALVVLAGIAAGERGQRTYLRNRYADPQFAAAGLNAAFRWARPLSGTAIATTGTRQYPLFGTDLSNEVEFVGVERPNGGFVRPEGCRAWRQALNEGRYRYVVATRDRIEPGRPTFPPEARWTDAGGSSVVLRRAPTVVFRIDGRLDPRRCGSAPG
jgi:hypothetical protein